MIQFMIVAVIVGWVTAAFFGVPASLRVGVKLTEYWILAGFLITVLEPFFGLLGFIRNIFLGISRIFRD